MKAAKDAEIRALTEKHEKERAVLEERVRVLECVNSKVNQDKASSETENERLATKLSFTETTNNALTNELSSLRGQLEQVVEEKATTERCLFDLKVQLSSLEYSNSNQAREISQTEAKRSSAEKVSADAKQTLARQHSQMEDLRRRLEEAELETSKYKDLTSR